MSWLIKGDRVLASLEVADGARARARGLIGRDGIDGAMLIRPCRGVHSFGMRFPIDVAFVAPVNNRGASRGGGSGLGGGARLAAPVNNRGASRGGGSGLGGGAPLAVIDIVELAPNRIGWFRMRARAVLEAEAGAFDRWGLTKGDLIEIRD